MSNSAFYDPDELYPDDLTGILVSETQLQGVVNNYPVRRRAVPYEAIDLYADNDRTFRVFIKTPDLNVVDLTGATGVLTVKETKDSASPSIQKSTANPSEGAIGAANKGEMFFYIVPADTASLTIRQYVYDIEVTLSDGKKYTTATGVLNLLQPIG